MYKYLSWSFSQSQAVFIFTENESSAEKDKSLQYQSNEDQPPGGQSVGQHERQQSADEKSALSSESALSEKGSSGGEEGQSLGQEPGSESVEVYNGQHGVQQSAAPTIYSFQSLTLTTVLSVLTVCLISSQH